jgi:uncharacterized OB-fold protein
VSSKRRLVDDRVIAEGPTGPNLLGSRCRKCGNVSFPVQSSCPRCTSDEMHEEKLPREGRLWSFTVQGFPPPSPPYRGPVGDQFVPFGVGYVELPGAVRVETRLTESDPERLHIGDEMRLVLVPLTRDEDGTEVIGFAFEPTTTGGQ